MKNNIQGTTSERQPRCTPPPSPCPACLSHLPFILNTHFFCCLQYSAFLFSLVAVLGSSWILVLLHYELHFPNTGCSLGFLASHLLLVKIQFLPLALIMSISSTTSYFRNPGLLTLAHRVSPRCMTNQGATIILSFLNSQGTQGSRADVAPGIKSGKDFEQPSSTLESTINYNSNLAGIAIPHSFIPRKKTHLTAFWLQSNGSNNSNS